MTDREAYIALNMIEGIGPIKVQALIDALGSPQAVFDPEHSDLRMVKGIGEKLSETILTQRTQVDPLAEIEQAEALGIRIITPLDSEYPDALKTIHDPPLALYVRGKLEPRDRHALGIVGSRKCTSYGLSTADRLAYQLAQTGFTVVSGLARGIDSAAHEGALKAKGRTIAVLGAAIDQLYPPENAELADAIAGSGAVISEYPLGRPADRQTFPYRNRIISGLSLGVLVAEAGENSGALITVRTALEQNREVFSVPGNILSPTSRGTNGIIKDGAKLVQSVTDILEELNLTAVAHQIEFKEVIPASDTETVILNKLSVEPVHIDEICQSTGLSAATVSSTLAMMELKGMVKQVGGMNYVVARQVREEYSV